ncbi:centromere kinetochore component CENP-T-domain-containing protein [Echria macrotheca]|uniref:Centromere kinetochore component CENP-T-domain-containing protein n=1 Tax=Echria macrotheca TaxID=438768 RepID=A0AAJ0F7Z9_9PEZI|nr:centromere kinetochore component CENP-T-domain-containing protein [Echria macrotheca]
MARESHPPGRNPAPDPDTPVRRAISAEPGSVAASSRLSFSIRTPASQGRNLTLNRSVQGLSASGRKAGAGAASATPHARAAFRTIDSRRAAISTPHLANRRRSVREARETPRDVLRNLGKALAKTSEAIKSSSSSPKSPKPADDTILEERPSQFLDDDDDEDLPKRPRLSLPIDVDEDDDDELRPHRSAGLEDEDLTMRSVEMPRRAYSEQPARLSTGSVRISDYYGRGGEAPDDEDGIDPGFFPPRAPIPEEDFGFDDDGPSYDRSGFDMARRDTLGRASDFGLEVPLDMANESTVMLAPQLEDSPMRPPPEDFAPMFDQRSDDDDDDGDNNADMEGFPDPVSEPEEDNEVETVAEARTPVTATVTAKSAITKRGSSTKETIKRTKRISRHSIEYPSLPAGVVKRLAQTFAKTSGAKGKINPETLKAIIQASDWFFEQIGEDLEAYAKHAHRKTIDESDMLTLMKRQRQTSSHMTPFALAQRHLPRELLQELRMTPPVAPKKRRRASVGEDPEVT